MRAWLAAVKENVRAAGADLMRHALRTSLTMLGIIFGVGAVVSMLSIGAGAERQALEMIDIDSDGLDEMDKRLLEAMIYKFDGGPVGLNSLAVAVGEDASTIEEVYEPYLIMQGLFSRTPRGRIAMPRAYEKMDAEVPKKLKEELGGSDQAELPLDE